MNTPGGLLQVETELAGLKNYPELLGKIVGNLLSLELALRFVLHRTATPAEEPLPALTSLKAGDVLPVTALTNWDHLGALIAAYNASSAARANSPAVDPDIKKLRDALVHGRIMAPQPRGPLTLVRFSKPSGDTVTVEDTWVMSDEWLRERNAALHSAAVSVGRRLSELI